MSLKGILCPSCEGSKIHLALKGRFESSGDITIHGAQHLASAALILALCGMNGFGGMYQEFLQFVGYAKQNGDIANDSEGFESSSPQITEEQHQDTRYSLRRRDL